MLDYRMIVESEIRGLCHRCGISTLVRGSQNHQSVFALPEGVA
jgi:hypothetical protein